MTHATGDQVTQAHSQQRMAVFGYVWGGLLALTGLEVFLAYNQFFAPEKMLAVLLTLSVIKSVLIIGWFMHLKYEYVTMRWVLMTALSVCLVLMVIFYPDAHRVLMLGTPASK